MKRINYLSIRTGFGFDSHAFSQRGSLVLGGVRVQGCPALAGHSDGDALIHAVIDSLLGATGLGDIGLMYPDTSKKTKGMSSLVMLKQVITIIEKKKFSPVHIDITVVAQKPRLSPIKQKMIQVLSKTMGISSSCVNIKAKTPEGLIWFVPEGGIAVWAVSTVGQYE